MATTFETGGEGKIRVPTGRGKLEKVREFEWSGKGRGNIFFGKVRENENWCHQMLDF